MQLQCPCCGEQFPFEAGFADADGKRLAALLAGVEPKLGRAVLNYLRLFSASKRGLRMTKAIRLIEELLDLINAGQVQRDARTSDSKPAPPRLWASGIEQMIAGRERLQLPLENHNYLRAVVYGIASDPNQAAQAAPAKPVRVVATAQQALQEEVGRIQADVLLGLIDKEEGARRIAALRGGA
ncbi:hypothetical protein D9M68_678990 [compost metagenome]